MRHLIGFSGYAWVRTVYAVEFHALALHSGRNWSQYSTRDSRARAVAREDIDDLEHLIRVATRVDHRLQERHHLCWESWSSALHSSRGASQSPHISIEVQQPLPGPSRVSSSPEEPIKLGQIQLSRSERERRIWEQHCLNCSSPSCQGFPHSWLVAHNLRLNFAKGHPLDFVRRFSSFITYFGTFLYSIVSL